MSENGGKTLVVPELRLRELQARELEGKLTWGSSSLTHAFVAGRSQAHPVAGGCCSCCAHEEIKLVSGWSEACVAIALVTALRVSVTDLDTCKVPSFPLCPRGRGGQEYCGGHSVGWVM